MIVFMAACAATAVGDGDDLHHRRFTRPGHTGVHDPRWGLTQGINFFRLHSQGKQDGVLAYIFQVRRPCPGVQ